MAEDRRPGTVYWIDHFAVPTNDLSTWINFITNVLGARLDRINGLTTEERRRGGTIAAFCRMPYSIADAFLQDELLPAAPEPGSALPRFGFFIRGEDIDQHLRRLDEIGVPHTDPIRSSEEGQAGTAIRFADPDGNQFEFWAPEHMPPGAMEGAGPLKVGRISHAVYESRDLDRTASFFNQYCALDPIYSSDIPKNTLSLAMAGGGRLVYKQVDDLGTWTRGRARWQGPHTALTVQADDYFPNYQRMWASLPESETTGRPDASVDVGALPARTIMHGSRGGRKWFELYGRGDDFYDYDTNLFHFIGGVGLGETPTLTYKARSMEQYVQMVAKDASGRPAV